MKELSAEDKKQIEESVGKKLGVKLDLLNKLDPNLISGTSISFLAPL